MTSLPAIRRRPVHIAAGVLVVALALVLTLGPATSGAAKGKKKPSSTFTLSSGDINVLVPEEGPPPGEIDGFAKLPIVGGKKLKGREIADVDVNLRATGVVETLSMRVTAPNGASAWLLRPGGVEGETLGSGAASCAGSFLTFADETPFFTGTAPFTHPLELPPPYVGRVQPDDNRPLFVMDGGKPKGTWTVTLLDDDDGVGQATVHCVQIVVKTRKPVK